MNLPRNHEADVRETECLPTRSGGRVLTLGARRVVDRVTVDRSRRSRFFAIGREFSRATEPAVSWRTRRDPEPPRRLVGGGRLPGSWRPSSPPGGRVRGGARPRLSLGCRDGGAAVARSRSLQSQFGRSTVQMSVATSRLRRTQSRPGLPEV